MKGSRVITFHIFRTSFIKAFEMQVDHIKVIMKGDHLTSCVWTEMVCCLKKPAINQCLDKYLWMENLLNVCKLMSSKWCKILIAEYKNMIAENLYTIFIVFVSIL